MLACKRQTGLESRVAGEKGMFPPIRTPYPLQLVKRAERSPWAILLRRLRGRDEFKGVASASSQHRYAFVKAMHEQAFEEARRAGAACMRR